MLESGGGGKSDAGLSRSITAAEREPNEPVFASTPRSSTQTGRATAGSNASARKNAIASSRPRRPCRRPARPDERKIREAERASEEAENARTAGVLGGRCSM
ncbi:MAG: hypothetical protein IPO88_32370 [Nannocystis sp.]|uniref:hypothetical protein n=1 Tax=Nannocystis sp. TaxID=1962667 RepID=UPI00242A10E2|nr:hypothetical protein [Nannocystis sp.]MBK9758131.1 hypothetical protein [Nannocystis sp.]